MRRLRLTWRLLRIAGLLALGGVLAVALSIRYRRLDAGNDSRRQLTRWWLARLARALPFRVTVYGEAPSGPMLWLANHVSWSDIPLLGQLAPVTFLSKAEVRGWPLIGWLAAQAGTLFIRRGAGDGVRLCQVLAEQLRLGHGVLVFPEGTTTAGDRLKPFHPRLMAAAIETGAAVQPVAIRYRRDGVLDPIAPFVGEDELTDHLLRLLARPVAEVEIHLLPPIDSCGLDRGGLARRAQAAIEAVILETTVEAEREAA